MQTVFIIHGVGGNPQENWFPWLKHELETLGYNVIVPQFPTPEDQTLDNWLKVLGQYRAHITPDTIMIGHSLGATFILQALQHYHIQSAYLVAGFASWLNNAFDENNKSFLQANFDWALIREHCKNFTILQSDNDPYVPFSKAEELAKQLHTTITVLHDAGHISASYGYTQFPELLKLIKTLSH